MLVKECMTKVVELGSPKMTVQEAASKMRDGNFGILPVEDNDRLVGMITDRDIALRCVAEGRDCKKMNVGEVMTERVLYCYDDQSLDEAAQKLAENGVWRMPVLNRQKRLVGILSLGDMAKSHLNPQQLEKTIEKLAERSESCCN